jgi:hypothetical protein
MVNAFSIVVLEGREGSMRAGFVVVFRVLSVIRGWSLAYNVEDTSVTRRQYRYKKYTP